jgi:hypothetical protein
MELTKDFVQLSFGGILLGIIFGIVFASWVKTLFKDSLLVAILTVSFAYLVTPIFCLFRKGFLCC